MGRFTPSVYKCLSFFECYLTGFRAEHAFLAIQMLVAIALSLVPMVINKLWQALGNGTAVTCEEGAQAGTYTCTVNSNVVHGNTIWCVLTVVVVMEPNMGGALRKGLQRALGAAFGGGLGLATLRIADLIANHNFNLSDSHNPLAPWTIVCVSVVGALLILHKQRFPSVEHFFFLALFSLPIVAAMGLRDGSFDWQNGLLRIANVEIGVLISTLVSVAVFPIRARWLLQRDAASFLIKLGDLGVWVLNQVCVTPNPDLTLPGASYTDKSMTYGDDGVEAKLKPLVDTVLQRWEDLAQLNVLLGAADKEWYAFKKPRVFPTEQYKTLLKSCATLLSLMGSLLHWLQSTVVNLQLVSAHSPEIRELAVQVSSSLTALSWLVKPPKSMKKKRKQGKLWRWLTCACLRRPRPAKAGSEGGSDGASAAGHRKGSGSGHKRSGSAANGSAAAGAALPGTRQAEESAAQQQQQQQQQHRGGGAADLEAGLAPVVGAEGALEDDPFAELAEAHLAQQAQHAQHAQHEGTLANGDGAHGAPAAAAIGKGGHLDAGAVEGPEDKGSACPRGKGEVECGELALQKLEAMAVALQRLVESAALERVRLGCADAGASPLSTVPPPLPPPVNVSPAVLAAPRPERGLQQAGAFDTLLTVINLGVGLGRQLGAMFTALDPAHARTLHNFIKGVLAEIGDLQGKLQEEAEKSGEKKVVRRKTE